MRSLLSSLTKAAACALILAGCGSSTPDTDVEDEVKFAIELVSKNSNGVQATGTPASAEDSFDSDDPSISADGRYVAYCSDATNLAGGDTNGATDVFVFDRSTGAVERVSVGSGGAQADGRSYNPSISANGRYVAFQSRATNLVNGDTNGSTDIFVYDRDDDAVERVSVGSAGAQANDGSMKPAISADGRYVAFESYATNLVTGDANGSADVFVYDRSADAVERVSVGSGGAEGNADSVNPSISADGRYVAFESDATNLATGDTNGSTDIFVYDRDDDAVERVSVSSSGAEANGSSNYPAISPDGGYVAFCSTASNLVPNDGNGMPDVFAFDRTGRLTARASASPEGGDADSGSFGPKISSGGRFVAFLSDASNLVSDEADTYAAAYILDRTTGATSRLSRSASGEAGNEQGCGSLSINPEGSLAAFSSYSTNLVAGDTNGYKDIFVARLR